MTKPPAVAVLGLLLLQACDVPGRLILSNKSKEAVKVRFTMKNDDFWNQRAFNLDPSGNGRRAYEFFGFGWNWSDERIETYVAGLERIDLISPSDSVGISDQDTLIDLFRARRHGLMRKNVTFKIRRKKSAPHLTL